VSKHSFRYANIGIAVAAAIIWGGVILFRNSEAAVQAVGLIGFFSAFVVYHGLDERACRREGISAREKERSQ
jgi:hypothetical protein